MNIGIRKAAGFTLVEIMLVVSLVGMLATISVPGFLKARDTANLNVIRTNLRMIQDVKQQWAWQNGAASTAVPSESDLQVYLKGNQMPRVIAGEVYNINSVDELATAVISSPMAGYPAGTTILP